MTRQRQNLLIVATALVVLAVAALEIGTEISRGRPGDHPAIHRGDPTRFKIDAGSATDAQRRAVADGLAAMQRWLGAHGGAVVTRDTDVKLTDRSHCGVHDALDDETTGVAIDGRRICVFTADSPLMGVPTFIRQTAAHEAVHILQHQLGCGGQLPRWLLEGMAEDLSWRAVDPKPDEAALRSWAQTLEADAGEDHKLNYGAAMGAVLEIEDGHPGRLVAFCRTVGDGAPWPLAFGEVFRTSAGRYDARF